MRQLGLLLLLLAVPAFGEKKYKITPDSPEEKVLLEIQGEPDARKRLAMLDDFTQKFAASEALPFTHQLYLAAYVETQQYDKAIEHGEKAAEADNEELATLINLLRATQAKGDFARTHKWTMVAQSLRQKALANRPPEMDDDDWKKRQETLKSYSEFMEYSLWEAVSRDSTPQRATYIAAFAEAFPESPKAKQVPAMYALMYQQAGDIPRAIENAEKAIAADPENETMLLVLGEIHVAQRKKLAEAQQLAQQLLKVMDAKKRADGVAEADWSKYLDNYRGAAHSIVGRSLMLQDKSAAAIPELQTAAKMLQGNTAALDPVLYYLGFAYAKLNRFGEARGVLNESVKMGGPHAGESRKLLAKLPAAAKSAR